MITAIIGIVLLLMGLVVWLVLHAVTIGILLAAIGGILILVYLIMYRGRYRV